MDFFRFINMSSNLGGGERAPFSFDRKTMVRQIRMFLGGCLTYFFNFHPDSADSWGN